MSKQERNPGCLPFGHFFGRFNKTEEEPVRRGPWSNIRASEERRLVMVPACLTGGPEGLVDRRGKRFFAWDHYRTLIVTKPSESVIYHLGEIKEKKHKDDESKCLEIKSLEPMVYFYLPFGEVPRLSVDFGDLTIKSVVPQPGEDQFAPAEKSDYDFCDWEGSKTARFWLLFSPEEKVMAIVFSWIDKETGMCRLIPVITGASGDLDYERKLMIQVIQNLASEEGVSGFYTQAKEEPMIRLFGAKIKDGGLGFKEVYPRVRRSRVVLKEKSDVSPEG